MAIEIVDFPMKNGGSFHGKMLVHQRVWQNLHHECCIGQFLAYGFISPLDPHQKKVGRTHIIHISHPPITQQKIICCLHIIPPLYCHKVIYHMSKKTCKHNPASVNILLREKSIRHPPCFLADLSRRKYPHGVPIEFSL